MRKTLTLAISAVCLVAAASPTLVGAAAGVETSSQCAARLAGGGHGVCIVAHGDWVDQDGYAALTRQRGEPTTLTTSGEEDRLVSHWNGANDLVLTETPKSIRLESLN